jgi:beta-glucosidase
MTFPSDFTWGVATASYQIEGSPHADGKGVSIWDTFVRQPGTILDGESGDVACDSYLRWRDDLQLLRDLGVDSYRFSIAWPRVLPFGRGEPNEAGLAYYERMIDDLLEAGIEPTVTLFHWDLPQALQDLGGWTNRTTAEAFADYAEVCFSRFGDRVPRWLTLNEPFVFVILGHLLGVHAPGIADPEAAARATHHALLGHGLAVQRFRASGATGRIGLANAEARIEAGVDEPGVEEAVEAARNVRTRLMLDPLTGRGHNASLPAAVRGAHRNVATGRRRRPRGDRQPHRRARHQPLHARAGGPAGRRAPRRAARLPRRPGRRRAHRDGLGGAAAGAG